MAKILNGCLSSSQSNWNEWFCRGEESNGKCDGEINAFLLHLDKENDVKKGKYIPNIRVDVASKRIFNLTKLFVIIYFQHVIWED